MAAVAGANLKAFGFTTVTGPHRVTTSNVPVIGCYIAAEYTGTYAAADDATFNAVTAIQAARRNGKTPTIRDACWAQAGLETVSGTDNNIAADTVTVSSPNITSQLVQNDLSTERADGAMGTWKEPVVYYVTFTEA